MSAPQTAFQYTVATLCGYEFVAIVSRGKIPTITHFSRRTKNVVGVIILAGLAAHFYLEGKQQAASMASTSNQTPWQ